MAWPKNTDPENKLMIETKALFNGAGIVSILANERQHPKTQAIIVSADELRNAIPHKDPLTGKRCRWQQFEVLIDLIGDERTTKGTTRSSPI